MIHTLDLHFLAHRDTIAAFLLITDAGPVLIETGPHSTFQTLEAALRPHGYAPADIGHVLLTHIHLDHAGAAWALAERGAKVYVHPFGATHLSDPSKLMDSARRIYQDQMDRLWGDMRAIASDQLQTVAHGQTLSFGSTDVRAWHTPGHAVHHVAWQVGEALFSGDVAGVRIGDGPVVPPCPPPDIHIEDWQNSLRLIRELGVRTLYLTHYGPETQVNAHLDELEARLLSWAEWMRPRYEAGTPASEITPVFQAFVRRQLAAAGVEGEHLDQYEAANPAWMSVAGLLRYWKKKLAA